MNFRNRVCVVMLICCLQIQGSYAEKSDSFSVFTRLSEEDSQKLILVMAYLVQDRTKIDEVIFKKSRTLRSIIGFPKRTARFGGATRLEVIREKRGGAYAIYRADQRAFQKDVEHCADAVSAFPETDARKVAAYLFDLAVSIDPTNLELAYRSEVFSIANQIDYPWVDSGMKVYRFEVQQGGGRENFDVPFNGLKKSQALIKGLLVQQLRGSQFVGEASQMNATVIRNPKDSEPMKVSFNQRVGPSMTNAVSDMMKFHRKRQFLVPTGVSVEISFEEQYISKDGPSAGVASALLLESLFAGHTYDLGFAVTGAMDGEGKVGAVGGVDGKIRGAIARKCSIVAIPKSNEATIRDLMILEGPASLAKIQVIGITVFDDALKLAIEDQKRDSKTKAALYTFAEVQKLLNQPGGLGYLPNPKVQAKLRSVVQMIPDHFSAKYLLLKGMGRNPSSLSLIGSVQAIDRNAAPLIRSLENGDFEEDKLGKDNFGKAIGNLSRVRPSLDKRCRPCADAIMDYAKYIRTAINSWPSSRRAQQELVGNIKQSGTKVGREYDNLFNREDVKKELLQD